MNPLSRFLPLGLAVLASAFSTAFATAPTLVDTGIQGYPVAMNSSGQFIANSEAGGYFVDPATGSVQLLPSVGAGGVSPEAINDSGMVFGRFRSGIVDAYGNDMVHTFVWSAATGFRDIGTLPGGNWVFGKCLNDAGQISGFAETTGGNHSAFLWDGTMHDLGTLGGTWSEVEGMNNHGQIVGEAARADGTWVPFIWDAAQGMREIPVGQDYAQPYGISDDGVVVLSDPAGRGIVVWDAVNGARTFAPPAISSPMFLGWRLLGFMNDGRAVLLGNWMTIQAVCLWSPVGGLQAIPFPDGSSNASFTGFSKSGYVVGSANVNGVEQGMIWDQTHGIRLLPNLGGDFTRPQAVNDLGQVTGAANTAGSERHAFLWDAANGIQDLGVVGSPYSEGSFIKNGVLAGITFAPDWSSSHVFYAKLSAATADTEPPAITSLSASPNVIWPVNKKMIPVTIAATATDNVGVTSLKIVSVTSSEPASNFYQLTGDLSLALRADRAGNGPGRTYTITVEAADAAGNTSTKTVAVVVPHDQRK